ncbi:unnamed protein product [Boreogadus saida]
MRAVLSPTTYLASCAPPPVPSREVFRPVPTARCYDGERTRIKQQAVGRTEALVAGCSRFCCEDTAMGVREQDQPPANMIRKPMRSNNNLRLRPQHKASIRIQIPSQGHGGSATGRRPPRHNGPVTCTVHVHHHPTEGGAATQTDEECTSDGFGQGQRRMAFK